MKRKTKRRSWTGLAPRKKVTPNDDPYGVRARLVQEIQDAGKRVDDYDATMALARAGLLAKPDGQKRAAKANEAQTVEGDTTGDAKAGST